MNKYNKDTCPKDDTWFANGGKCGWSDVCLSCSEMSKAEVQNNRIAKDQKTPYHTGDADHIIYHHSSVNMHEIPDNSIHLIITSPPYPMIKKWDELFGKVDFEHQHSILDKVWDECYRILVEGGICCINIGDATRSVDNIFQCYPNFARVTMSCKNKGFVPLIPIHWKKISNRPNAFLGSGFLPTSGYIAQDYEYIGIFRKGKIRKFKPKDLNRINSQFTKAERDIWFQQTWDIKGARGAGKTSEFPEEVPYRLIRMFSVIGDIVVDPFCGTGTVNIVAMNNKRKFVGYDIH